MLNAMLLFDVELLDSLNVPLAASDSDNGYALLETSYTRKAHESLAYILNYLQGRT